MPVIASVMQIGVIVMKFELKQLKRTFMVFLLFMPGLAFSLPFDLEGVEIDKPWSKYEDTNKFSFVGGRGEKEILCGSFIAKWKSNNKELDVFVENHVVNIIALYVKLPPDTDMKVIQGRFIDKYGYPGDGIVSYSWSNELIYEKDTKIIRINGLSNSENAGYDFVYESKNSKYNVIERNKCFSQYKKESAKRIKLH